MPSLASSTGPMPAISCPIKRTSPAVGRSRPVATLTSVVLPAPFGPTIETNSPSLTWKETLLSALNAPKAFETLMVSNKGAFSAARAGCISPPSMTPVGQRLDRARQALRHEHHEQHQHGTHYESPVLGGRHHEVRKPHPKNLHPDIGGLAGVLADRAQMQTEWRLGDAPHRQPQQREQNER